MDSICTATVRERTIASAVLSTRPVLHRERAASMRFSYGLANFQALIEEGYLYIDRTDHIRRIEDGGKQLLLLRPRRFGKSLWLSTLESCS